MGRPATVRSLTARARAVREQLAELEAERRQSVYLLHVQAAALRAGLVQLEERITAMPLRPLARPRQRGAQA